MLNRLSLTSWDIFIWTIIGALLFSSLPARGATTISSNITSDTTWNAAGSPYIIGADIAVASGATLTIESNTIVKFNYFSHDLIVEGTLNASGASGPIIFTEIRDDVGGDTNGDGSGSSPFPGSWGRIEFVSGSSGVMDNVDIRYGGYASAGQLIINGGSLTLTNSSIQYSSSHGVRIQNSNPVLTGNNYHDNSWAAIGMDLGSNPGISGVSLSNNGINGLLVDGGTFSGDGYWDDPDIVYVTNGDITLPAGTTLTVGPGQVVKFGYFSYDLFVNGTLNALGTDGAPIVFTELRDDTAGGDTNNNADASSPWPDNWGRIELSGPDNSMEYVDIRYGGYASNGQLTVSGGVLSLTNSIIRHSSKHGVRIQNSNPVMTDNSYHDNSWAAIGMDLGSNPAISGVTMSNNTINGLQVDGGTLSGDGYWDDPDIVYVTNGDITVPAGMTLTVGAGQVVKFGYFSHDLFVNGTLEALGTGGAPIVFTELHDDTAGGDTNNDADASGPWPGNWGRIELNGPDNIMEYVDIRYGGYSSDGQLTHNGSSLSLTNSIIRHSSRDGMRIQNSDPVMTDNTFHDNTRAAVYMDLDSNPAIIGVTMSNNGINGLLVDGGTLNSDGFWDDPDIVYWTGGDITVPAGMKLTVGSGQVVKLGYFSHDLFVNGTLEALGTGGAPIVFTELHDDTAGGDTNNDADASGPWPGNWGRIELNGPDNIMEYVDIRYGGYSSDGQLTHNGSSLSLTNSIIRHSSRDGMRIQNSDPVMTDNTFHDNTRAAVYMDLDSNPAISGVTMSNNGINGLLVDGGTLNSDGFWDDPDIVYVTNGDITVPAGMKLTVGPGQVVKLGYFSHDLFVNGTLEALGVFAAPIVFTELRDDTAGGDTNNDADGTSPWQGYWGRIELLGPDSYMEHVHLRYGGYASAGLVSVNGGDLALVNSEIRNTDGAGLWAGNGSRAAVSSSLLHHNSVAGIRVDSGSMLTAINNTVDGNGRGVDVSDADVWLTNNLVTNSSWDGIRAAGDAAIELSHNNVFNPGAADYTDLTNPTGINGNISADPLYADPASFNYGLQAGSPAIDSAGSDGAPIDDFFFSYRFDDPATVNTGSGDFQYYDMGAIEFGGIPRTVKHRPEGGTVGPVPSIRFTFRSKMDTESFAIGDDLVGFSGPSGPISASGFEWPNPYMLDISFSPQYGVGDYQMVIGPNILDEAANPMDTDADGNPGEIPGDRYTAVFTITPPKIVSHSPSGFTNGPLDTLHFTFDRPMDQGSFTLGDIASFTGPDGDLVASGHTWIDPQILEVFFDPLTVLGEYNMVIGPGISDAGGNTIDQDGDLVYGEIPDDQYSAGFFLADIIHVSGAVDSDTTWRGITIVDDQVTVNAGVTLTIEPGTIVKFDASQPIGITLNSGATLVAEGSVAEPIIITSLLDDAAGGDVNLDGSATVPDAGDWRWIYINGGTATFDHVQMRYGGGSPSGNWDQTGMIRTSGSAALTVSNSILEDAFFDGILAWGGTADISNTILTGIDRAICAHPDSTVNVVNTTLDDNRVGLLVHGGTLDVANTIVTNSLSAGVLHDYGPDAFTIRYSNLWNPGATDGNYVGTADQTGVNGNLSVDPQYRGSTGSSYHLGYVSPMIDAADGIAAPATDKMGAPRYDDPRTINTGIPTGNGEFADMGALEFVESAVSDIDLIVTSVFGASAGVAGQEVSVQWRVKNIGSALAGGSWHDKIYLSADTVWTPDDKLLGAFLHDGDVGPDLSYENSAEVTLPGVTPGDYYFIVRTNPINELFEGQNLANNATASDATTTISLPFLILGTPKTGTLSATGDAMYYRLTVPENDDLKVTLDGPAGVVNELFVKYDSVPSRQSYDVRGIRPGDPDQSVSLGSTRGGDYFVMVYGADVPSPQTFTISASLAGFAIDTVSPTAGSNTGQVTIRIDGAQFKSNSDVRLIDSNGQTTDTLAVYFIDTGRLAATFDLSGLPSGLADIQVVNTGNVTTTLPDAFNIISGVPGQLRTNLISPDRVRFGRNFTAYVEYTNNGDTDLIAPTLMLTAVSGLSKLSLTPDLALATANLRMLAVNPGGLPGILPPGGTGRITVYGNAGVSGSETLRLFIETYEGDIDWNVLEPVLRPTGVPDDVWDPLYAQLISQIGSQWSDFLQVLSQDANLLPSLLGQSKSVNDVFNLEIERAVANISTSVSGRLFLGDLEHPLGNIELILYDESTGNAATSVALNDGSFLFSEVPEGTYDVLVFGYSQQAPLQVVVTGGNVDGLDIILTRGGAVNGKVLIGGTGTPVPDATIMAVNEDGDFYNTMTGGDGMFSLPQVVPGNYTVIAESPQTSKVSFPNIEVTVGQTVHNINPVASTATTVTGTVKFQGSPVPGVIVSALSADNQVSSSTFTDGIGNYTLTGVVPGTYTLRAAIDGYSPSLLPDRVVGPEGSTGQDFSVEQAGTVSGMLTAAASAENIAYEYIVFLQNDVPVEIVQTAADGSFTASRFAPGTYDYHIFAGGMLETIGQVSVAAGQNTPLNLALEPAGIISGVVTDGQGAGVSGLRIELLLNDEMYDRTATDDTGYYDFINLPLGNYDVVLAANDWGSVLQKHAVTVSSGAENVNLDMIFALKAGVKGTVVETDGITPVAGIEVTLRKDGKPVASTVTLDDGSYAFNILQAGYYTVTASGLSAETAGVSLSPDEFIQGLQLTRGAESMEIQVLNSSGLPVPNAGVTLVAQSSMASANDIYDMQDRLPAGSTDYQGLLVAGDLAPGNYVMLVTAPDHEIFHNNITIAQGGQNQIPVTVEQGIEVGGAIERPDGSMVTGANILVLGSDPAGNLSGSFQLGSSASDDFGDFIIPDLPTGQDIIVRVTDGLSIQEFALSPGDLGSPLNLVLPDPLPAGVGGKVLNEGEPLTGAEITLLDEDGLFLDYRITDENAEFESHLVMPGEDIEVVVESEGFEPFSTVVTITDANSFVDIGNVALESVAATDDNMVPPRDNGGDEPTESNLLVDPVVTLPPAPPIPPPPDFEKCAALYDRAVRLNEILLSLGEGVSFANEANSTVNNLKEAGLVFFQANALAGSILGVLNPAQGAVDAITINRDQLVGDIARGRLPSPFVLDETIKSVRKLLAIDLAKSIKNSLDLIDRIRNPPPNYTPEQFRKDVSLFLSMVNDTKSIIENLFGAISKLEGLGAALGPLNQVISVVNAVKDAYDLAVEITTAVQNIKSRREALSNAEFVYNLALTKMKIADAQLKACENGTGPYGPNGAPGAPGSNLGNENNMGTPTSKDPNDKTGAAGFGAGGFIQPGVIPYLVQFENDPDLGATIPAQEVFVTDPLDDDLDLITLEFTGFGFNNFDFSVPQGLSDYETVIDQRPYGINLLVTVELNLNKSTRMVSATFRSLDPLTGELPDDVDAGFLPVNDKDLHNGEGYFTFIVSPKSGLPTGTQVTNQASIVFDVNDPIMTPVAVNTIDVDAPVSMVSALPATSPSGFTVQWSGHDGSGSGPAHYSIYVQDNGSGFQPWLLNTTATSAMFNGVPGHTYGFYSIATDNTGQVEGSKTAAEASTEIQFTQGDFSGDGIIDLADAVIVLQIMVGIDMGFTMYKEHDINGDNLIGFEELLYILQVSSGLR